MNAQRLSSAAFQRDLPNLVHSESRISSLALGDARVRVPQHRSKWVNELQVRFDTLTSLPRGWDGYAGGPVSFTVATFAANLLERLCIDGVPAPQLVPGGDGTLQFEWHRNQYDVEVDVFGPYDVAAVRRDHRTGDTEELEIRSDFTPLSKWVADLVQKPAQYVHIGV